MPAEAQASGGAGRDWAHKRCAISTTTTVAAATRASRRQESNRNCRWRNYRLSGAAYKYISRSTAGEDWVIIVVHEVLASGASGNNISQANFDTLLPYVGPSGVAVGTRSVLAAVN